jgi:hypothetical protein
MKDIIMKGKLGLSVDIFGDFFLPHLHLINNGGTHT